MSVEDAKFCVEAVPAVEVEPGQLAAATETLQACERLCLQLRTKDGSDHELYQKARESLSSLSDVKAQIEGSHFSHQPMSLNTAPLMRLKQLTLMHTPSSVTAEVKSSFSALINQAVEGKCQRVLSSVLLTCPWWEASQRERGEQAKHNILLVVYLCHDDQFFDPASRHEQKEGEVVDLGWLCAVELNHLGLFLSKGRTRFVEALFCHQGALITSSTEWDRLTGLLDALQVMSLKGFVEGCRGQAVGGITKKRKKDGSLKLKPSTTMRDICESFRLLNHLENLLQGGCLCLDVQKENLPLPAQDAVSRLWDLYDKHEPYDQVILPLLLQWSQELNKKLTKFKFVKPEEVEGKLGAWLMETRLQGRQLQPLPSIGDSHSVVCDLLGKMGKAMANKKPEQILLIARAGSYMYGLSTPESDVDYVVVFAEETAKLLSSCRDLTECIEHRGPSLQFEYGAYEARLLCEMLLKGSVVILELVFASDHAFMSPAWQALATQKQKLVTELALLQYMGLIKNNFSMIRSDKHRGTPRDRKLFYQIFHKLHSLEFFARGEPPPVRCEGDVQEFILGVRRQPLEGEARERLLERAAAQYEDLRQRLSRRTSRLPEKADFRWMTSWLKAVRGLPRS